MFLGTGQYGYREIEGWGGMTGPDDVFIRGLNREETVFICNGDDQTISLYRLDRKSLTCFRVPDHPHGLCVDSRGDLDAAERIWSRGAPSPTGRLQKFERDG